MSRHRTSLSRRRVGPAALLFALLLVVLVLAALVLTPRANDRRTTSGQATVAGLRTEVAGLRRQAAVQETAIAQQRRRIDQLQRLVATAQTPTYQANGAHSYIVLFQVDTYSCILYLEWVESNGIMRDGRLLTADNYARNGSKSFHFAGVDNNGRFGFTTSGQGPAITFAGTRNTNGTVTVTGLPWSIFYGFTGGTFNQTLHPATLRQYNAAAANLSP